MSLKRLKPERVIRTLPQYVRMVETLFSHEGVTLVDDAPAHLRQRLQEDLNNYGNKFLRFLCWAAEKERRKTRLVQDDMDDMAMILVVENRGGIEGIEVRPIYDFGLERLRRPSWHLTRQVAEPLVALMDRYPYDAPSLVTGMPVTVWDVLVSAYAPELALIHLNQDTCLGVIRHALRALDDR